MDYFPNMFFHNCRTMMLSVGLGIIVVSYVVIFFAKSGIHIKKGGY